MASRMIGRANCPECGFLAAHVKKSEKCTYRFCPECGAIYHAKTERQIADLMAKTRLQEVPSPTPPTPTPREVEKPALVPVALDVPAVAKPKRGGLW